MMRSVEPLWSLCVTVSQIVPWCSWNVGYWKEFGVSKRYFRSHVWPSREMSTLKTLLLHSPTLVFSCQPR